MVCSDRPRSNLRCRSNSLSASMPSTLRLPADKKFSPEPSSPENVRHVFCDPRVQEVMAMNANQDLGQRGENAAVRYLTGLGWTVLARNWRCAGGELDIVAHDGRRHVVCEVKTRASVA